VEYLFSQEEMEEMFLDMAGDKIEAERARLLEAGYEEAEQAEEYIVRGIEEMYLKNPAFVEQNRFKAVEGASEGINRVIPKLKKIIDFIQNGNEEDSTRRGRVGSRLRRDKTEYRREVGRGDAMEMRNAENKGGNAQEAATIIAIANAPTKYNPYKNPQECLKKRNKVLYAMYVCNVIDANEYEIAKESKLLIQKYENKEQQKFHFCLLF
jgi:hypothetical protein